MPRKVFLSLHDNETDLFLIITGHKSPTKRLLGITTGGRRLFGEKSTEHLYEPVDYEKVRVGLEGFNLLLSHWQKRRGKVPEAETKEVIVSGSTGSTTPSPKIAKMTLYRTQTGTMIFILSHNGRNFGYQAKHVPRVLSAVKSAIAWLSNK